MGKLWRDRVCAINIIKVVHTRPAQTIKVKEYLHNQSEENKNWLLQKNNSDNKRSWTTLKALFTDKPKTCSNMILNKNDKPVKDVKRIINKSDKTFANITES